MQTITVDEIIVKTGESAKGPWTLVIIKDDAGSEFTTFDTKLKDLPRGTKLEIDVEIKKGKANIKTFKILSQPDSQAAASGEPPSTGSQMSKGDWAAKDDDERASIEAQSVLNAYVALLVGNVKPDESMERIVFKALKLIEKHIDAQLGQPVAQTKSAEDLWGEDGPNAAAAVKATKDQIIAIEILIKQGVDIKSKLKEYNWPAKKPSELTQPQAARLIREATEEIPF